MNHYIVQARMEPGTGLIHLGVFRSRTKGGAIVQAAQQHTMYGEFIATETDAPTMFNVATFEGGK